MFVLSIPETPSPRVMRGNSSQPMAWRRRHSLSLNAVGVSPEVTLGVHPSEEFSTSGKLFSLETYGGLRSIIPVSSLVVVRAVTAPRPVRNVPRRSRQERIGLVRHHTTSPGVVLMRTSPTIPRWGPLNASLVFFPTMANASRRNLYDIHQYLFMNTPMRLRCSN